MPKVGDRAEMTRTVTEQDVDSFAAITGDCNALHTSPEYAARTRFGERIAHGMLTAGPISAVLGMKLPGPGCVDLSRGLVFLAPAKIGDPITTRVEVVEIIK
jgi:3-hydroxybutyryl-CoA dehydratase